MESPSGPELPDTAEYLSLDALLGRFFETEPRSLLLAEFLAQLPFALLTRAPELPLAGG